MIRYFQAELQADGWVRALSLSDPTMANVYSLHPTTEDLVCMRPDWTGTGAYGGLAGFAIDSLVALEGGFDAAITSLLNLSLAARSTVPAQGVAVMTPPYIYQFLENNSGIPAPSGPYGPAWPEWFDEGPPFPAWWPDTERTVQNAEASLVDTMIRSIFGWRPKWNLFNTSDNNCSLAAQKASSKSTNKRGKWSEPAATSEWLKSVEACVDSSLYLSNVSRAGFEGVLEGLATPWGKITIKANASGLSWLWTAQESAGKKVK